MSGFFIDETHLQRLTPGARRELLDILSAEISDLKTSFRDLSWDPEDNVSYPLSEDEALALVRSLDESGRKVLRVFARNFDGQTGRGELQALLAAGGYQRYDDLGQEISQITRQLRGITQNSDAWLINWRARDWQWDEASQTYTAGAFYISGAAILALREAYGIRDTANA
ncbi:MAG TPA: hypothetical protein VLS27_14030 [Gammaproteobacteria bacterium]|nr:hypothetical protein [Gammaproteobacteria bacterium]